MEAETEKSSGQKLKKGINWPKEKWRIWNSKTGEFLGRTGLGWIKIFSFYVIFFICLIGYWILMMFALLGTLDHDEPRYKLDSSVIGTNPGLGFRPAPPTTDRAVIWYNASRNETIDYWVSNLNDYLKPYLQNDTGLQLKTCSGNVTAGRVACRVPVPEGNHSCTVARQFGYPERKPCVLLKLNRIYGWRPDPYPVPPVGLSRVLKESFLENRVYVSCEGANPSDRDNIGEVEYFPHQGIPTFYYPFTNQIGYRSPFWFVQFQSISQGVLVKIKCQAWAQNIASNNIDYTGGVQFKLLVD